MTSFILALGIWCKFRTWWERAPYRDKNYNTNESATCMTRAKLYRNRGMYPHHSLHPFISTWRITGSWRTKSSLSRNFKQRNKQRIGKDILSKERCKTHGLEVGMSMVFQKMSISWVNELQHRWHWDGDMRDQQIK